MSARVLVAGIGDVFFGDDGFGVAAAQQLAKRALPVELEIIDVGVRGLHLAFALLDPPGLLIVVKAVRRGDPPGTISVIGPGSADVAPAMPDGHGVTVGGLFTSLASLGGSPPPTLVVGCEAETVEEGRGLSPAVAAAVSEAVGVVLHLARPHVARAHTAVPRPTDVGPGGP
jgi:hydrogenase maturation protease